MELIAHVAEEVNHLIYGKGVLSDEKTTEIPNRAGKSKPEKRQAGSFAVSTMAESTTEKPTPMSGQTECSKCDDIHPIYACSGFKKMCILDRRQLAWAKGPCFNCLRGGHVGSCPVDRGCEIDGCTVKHSKFLHLPRAAGSPQQTREPPYGN